MKNRTARILSLSVALCSLYAIGKCELPCEEGNANAFHPGGAVLWETGSSLALTNGVPGRYSVVFHGPNYLSSGQPFGHGTLCVNPVLALTEHGRFLDASGGARYPMPPTGRWAQVWYRDQDGEGNLSNMVQIGG